LLLHRFVAFAPETSSRVIRSELHRCGITALIPEPRDQQVTDVRNFTRTSTTVWCMPRVPYGGVFPAQAAWICAERIVRVGITIMSKTEKTWPISFPDRPQQAKSASTTAEACLAWWRRSLRHRPKQPPRRLLRCRGDHHRYVVTSRPASCAARWEAAKLPR
jgi:hypothetical protein